MNSVSALLLALHALLTAHCGQTKAVPSVSNPTRLKRKRPSSEAGDIFRWRQEDDLEMQSLHRPIDFNSNTGGPKKKMLAYVLCYSPATCQVAHDQFGAFSWSVILSLPQSLLFESYAFTYIFPRRIETDAWHEYEYVGTISWKAPLKFEQLFYFGSLNLTDVLAGAEPGTDVIALVGDSQNMVTRANGIHPRFKEVWTGLLQAFERFSPEEISTEGMTAFYCNYWFAKPEHVVRFIPFMKKAQQMLKTLPSIQAALWSDSDYPKNTNLTSKIINLDYYPYHPFVLERLAPFFFNVEKLKIHVHKQVGDVLGRTKKKVRKKGGYSLSLPLFFFLCLVLLIFSFAKYTNLKRDKPDKNWLPPHLT